MSNLHTLERALIKIEALAVAVSSLSDPAEHELKCELIEHIERVAREALNAIQQVDA